MFSDTTEIIIEGIDKEEDINDSELLWIPYDHGFLLGRTSSKEDFLVKR